MELKNFATKYNIKICNTRANNGVYSAKLFQDSCQKNQQNLTFCAVGAHWQNSIAKRFIGSITQHARTILLHAMARWPLVITEEMWPFAVCHAVTFHNASNHHDKNSSPHQLFPVKNANGSSMMLGFSGAQFLCYTKSYKMETLIQNGRHAAGKEPT
jgi:hypothetical protein